jgi:hypothetical protein
MPLPLKSPSLSSTTVALLDHIVEMDADAVGATVGARRQPHRDLSLSGGSIEGDSNKRFVGGRRDEGENLHRKRDGQSGQTGQ